MQPAQLAIINAAEEIMMGDRQEEMENNKEDSDSNAEINEVTS